MVLHDLITNFQCFIDNILSSFHDILTGCDRIVHTPLTLAYTIAIHQITWMYIILLPFQLDSTLKWISIPACFFAAYIILGLLLIGSELENPFGHDVNDLPLNDFCKTIAADLDVISSRKRPDINKIITSQSNKVLFPLSHAGYPEWLNESEEVIRGELRFKAEMMVRHRASTKAKDQPGEPIRSQPATQKEEV
jgi:ion channel-forming bestrophin family protein